MDDDLDTEPIDIKIEPDVVTKINNSSDNVNEQLLLNHPKQALQINLDVPCKNKTINISFGKLRYISHFRLLHYEDYIYCKKE